MHGARERSSQEGRGGGYGWEVGEVGRVGGGWGGVRERGNSVTTFLIITVLS